MKNKKFLYIIVAVLLLTFLSSFYIVQQTKQAIVLQFGEAVKTVKEPGLKVKIPFIQTVVYYDNRLLNFDPPVEEVVLNDKKRLDVDSFTYYKIVDPLRFHRTVGSEYGAKARLEKIVNSSLREVLGKVTLKDLLSSRRTEIMESIRDRARKDAVEFGVDIADVRIRKADLPIQVLQAINNRMKAERERDAKDFRAKGQQKAQQIRATAEKERDVIIAKAEKEAQMLKGQGDKIATKVWAKAANRDPKFYDFYRSLEAYKKSLANGDASLVLSPDSEFFRYFDNALKVR
jgi:membrane protease subunit HflC